MTSGGTKSPLPVNMPEVPPALDDLREPGVGDRPSLEVREQRARVDRDLRPGDDDRLSPVIVTIGSKPNRLTGGIAWVVVARRR